MHDLAFAPASSPRPASSITSKASLKLLALAAISTVVVTALSALFFWSTFSAEATFVKSEWVAGTCVVASLALASLTWRSLLLFRAHIARTGAAQAANFSVFSAAADAVLMIEENGRIAAINPAAERMFVRSRDTTVGKDLSCVISDTAFLKTASSKASEPFARTARRSDGSEFPIEVTVSRNTVQGRTQFIAVARDVTARRRQEEALKQVITLRSNGGSEMMKAFVPLVNRAVGAELAFLFEARLVGSAVTGTLTLSREGTPETSGFFELGDTAVATVLTGGVHKFAAGARSQYPRDPLLANFQVEGLVAVPLTNTKGRVLGVLGAMSPQPLENVDALEETLQVFAERASAELERKAAEEALNAEKERLAGTLRSIREGFITIDSRGGVQLMNSTAEMLSGWSQMEAAGQPLSEVFHLVNERTRRSCTQAIQRVITTGFAPELDEPTLLISRDGTDRLVQTSAGPIRDRSGQQTGAVLLFRDVTERARHDEERRKVEKLESLGVTAGGIAHDFNNLLTCILGNLSLTLLSPKLDAQLTERLTSAKKASLRAQEIAQQLLTFAKGGAPVKQVVSIAPLVRDSLGFAVQEQNLRCITQIADDLWPAELDAGQMTQVLTNLFLNAQQAMPAGGTLRVECANLTLAAQNTRLGLEPGRYLKITVQDEGIGIPEEIIKKIFDPYFSTKPKGSGLGLATAFSIIRNHNGVIDVMSRAGEGTTFFVYIPASERPVVEQPVLTPAPAATMASSVSQANRVLVLDDEEAICALVTCALEPLGYQVTETNDALTAIRTYEEALNSGQPFDLVISDLTLPGGMGGREAVRRLREINPALKAIVSSGYANDPVMSHYREHGFCAMIAKPYEIAALGRMVGEVLSGSHQDVVDDAEELRTA